MALSWRGRRNFERGPDETQGGQRIYKDPNDYYDVLGPGGSLTRDGVIDLPNDVLGVILQFNHNCV